MSLYSGKKWRTKEPLDESESEKVGLKLNIQKTKILASSPITSRQIVGGTVKTVADFIFLNYSLSPFWVCEASFLANCSVAALTKSIVSSVRVSHSVLSDSLRPHGLQHSRPPCPSPAPGAYSNSCPLSQWCHPTISSSFVPFSSCLQSFPASGSFQMSQFFTSGGQNVGVSASTSVLPMNIQDWSPLGWIGWVSLQSIQHLNDSLEDIIIVNVFKRRNISSYMLKCYPNNRQWTLSNLQIN